MAAIFAAPLTAFPDGPLPDASREPIAFATALIDAVWTHRRFNLVREAYDAAARWQGPGGRRLFGRGEIAGWTTALTGSFGDARFVIENVAVTPAEGGHDIAVRWTMAGTHDGPALYGPPTGQQVYVLAVTHWRTRGGVIVDEVTVYDEIALLRQLEGGL